MNQTLTVTEATKIIKSSLESNPVLAGVAVKGEISNITYHSSGHIYFTMKDAGAVLSAAFFKNSNRSSRVKLEEGMSIVALGSISVYEKRGGYQLIVRSVMSDGIGELQLKIEALKKKLTEEGVFSVERKRALPYLPKRVGVVSSPTGAAFRDILKVLLRRFPTLEVLLAPAKVQGDDAAATIVRAIEELNKPEHEVDLIIAGRGGGSFEDLMPFNEEPVVRAYAESVVPIISAVGHQIDHPLSDDAADAYAPTPSAAAEIAVPLKSELDEEIAYIDRAMLSYLDNMIERSKQRLSAATSRRSFLQPLDLINMRQITVDELTLRLDTSVERSLRDADKRFSELLDISALTYDSLKERKHKLLYAMQALDQLSPLKVMARGYAAVKDSADNFVKSIGVLKQGDEIDLYFHDGKASCSVKNVEQGVTLGKKED